MEKFQPQLANSCAGEWEDYKRSFLVHLDSKGLHEAPGRRKVGQLLKCMGVEHVRTYDTFTWAPAVAAVAADAEHGIEAVAPQAGEDKYDLDTVFKKFDAQFGVHRYRSIKRQEFLSLQRGDNEGIMSFISSLKRAARYCSYGDFEESFVCDMIINRVRDRQCSEKLMELSDTDLNLENVTRICRQVELTRSHLDSLDQEKNVHYGRMQQKVPPPQCPKCLYPHSASNVCRADSRQCLACGEFGHFLGSKICRQPAGQVQVPARGRGWGGRGRSGRRGRGRGRGYGGYGGYQEVHQTEAAQQPPQPPPAQDECDEYGENFENVL
jgi:hypothetical protein